jgi:hypothetical protein
MFRILTSDEQRQRRGGLFFATALPVPILISHSVNTSMSIAAMPPAFGVRRPVCDCGLR